MKHDFDSFVDNRVMDLYAEFAASGEQPGPFLRKVANAEVTERAAIVDFLTKNRELDFDTLVEAIKSGCHR